MVRAAVAAFAIVVAGCVNRPIWVEPMRVEAVSAQLRAGQAVTVEPELHAPVTLRPEQVVELQLATGQPVTLRLEALVRDCPLDDDPKRLCSAGEVERVIVGHEQVMGESAKAAVAAGVLIGGMVGLGYCWSQCGGPWDTVSAVSFVAIGVVVGLAVVQAWGATWGR